MADGAAQWAWASGGAAVRKTGARGAHEARAELLAQEGRDDREDNLGEEPRRPRDHYAVNADG